MKPNIQTPPSAAPDAPATAAETRVSETDLLHNELGAQKDLYLHLTADFENFKRRSREEATSRAAALKESFIQELLPVIDNLERSLTPNAVAHDGQFRQGVEMTLQQMQLLLRKHGVETEEIVGKPFDPHLHDALSQRHDPAQPNHAVLEVFQRGYRKGGKVFRPAKVSVNEPSEHDPKTPNTVHHAR